jgi:hypothetical protein
MHSLSESVQEANTRDESPFISQLEKENTLNDASLKQDHKNNEKVKKYVKYEDFFQRNLKKIFVNQKKDLNYEF